MVRYPLKRILSVGLNVGIHLSSTFQRAFFHSSKHFLILAWWMRKRWNHLGCLFEVVRTFFGKYDLRPVSGHCLRKLLLCLDFGLSNGIQVADTSPPVKTIAVYFSSKWIRRLSLLRINGISQKYWLASKPAPAAKLQLYRDGWFFHFAIDVYCATMMRKRPPF